jgi:hypothetical protein
LVFHGARTRTEPRPLTRCLLPSSNLSRASRADTGCTPTGGSDQTRS